jgi:protein-S-isoprenylcysteine O-methyltransferase Ste14
MKAWTPRAIYETKPWFAGVVGLLLAVGAMVWSLAAGSWTVWRGLLCFTGATLAVVGGAMLQLRQDYRARSKWRRKMGS